VAESLGKTERAARFCRTAASGCRAPAIGVAACPGTETGPPLAHASAWTLPIFPALRPSSIRSRFAIVGGGTALVVVLRTPVRDLARGFSALRVLPRRSFRAEPLLDQIGALTPDRPAARGDRARSLGDRRSGYCRCGRCRGRRRDAGDDRLAGRAARTARFERHRAACESGRARPRSRRPWAWSAR
jgi:hypothetical protein